MAERNGGSEEAVEQPAKKVRKDGHCRRCGKTGYNTRTCTTEDLDSDDNDASK